MYGAILGDIIGSPYEFDMGDKTKDFPLFSRESCFTDDTVMTIAVAEALARKDAGVCYVTDGGKLAGVVTLPHFLNKVFRD